MSVEDIEVDEWWKTWQPAEYVKPAKDPLTEYIPRTWDNDEWVKDYMDKLKGDTQ